MIPSPNGTPPTPAPPQPHPTPPFSPSTPSVSQFSRGQTEAKTAQNDGWLQTAWQCIAVQRRRRGGVQSDGLTSRRATGERMDGGTARKRPGHGRILADGFRTLSVKRAPWRIYRKSVNTVNGRMSHARMPGRHRRMGFACGASSAHQQRIEGPRLLHWRGRLSWRKRYQHWTGGGQILAAAWRNGGTRRVGPMVKTGINEPMADCSVDGGEGAA